MAHSMLIIVPELVRGYMHREFFANLLPSTLLFGRFELVRCLSAGSFGGVYLCKDLQRVGKEIVLKILSTQAASDPQVQKRFRDEVTLSRLIKHPNVLHSSEYMRDDDFIAFTMDYMKGGTLGDLMTKGNVIPVERALNMLLGIARGIAAIHELGVVHRDIKPENILLDNLREPRISDFGIASSLTTPGQNTNDELMGSINYLSPEYVEKGVFDHKSDLYSFGVVAYELLTGRLPFEGQSIFETLTERVQRDPVSPRTFRPEMSGEIESFVMTLMKRNPQERFASAQEMVQILESLVFRTSSRRRPSQAQPVENYTAMVA